ncbi:MAG: WD40/YVTN/BNR-like repeat-containing protein [Desulfuromonadales bacterium]
MQSFFSTFFANPFRLSLRAGLTLVVMAFISAPGLALAVESQIMPLAEQSLLLDGQVIDGRIVVVGERGHILLSEDHGVTWQQQPAPTRDTLTSVYFTDPSNGWAAGHEAVILRTSDGGHHWQQVYIDVAGERPILDLWFKDLNQGYAVGGYGLFLMTHDGGKNWGPVDFDPATLASGEAPGEDPWQQPSSDETWGIDFHLNQITAAAGGRVYIAAEAGHLYRSDDGCRSWLSLPSPYEGSFYGTLPLGRDKLLAYGLRGHLFRSEDAGNSWAPLETGTQATLNDAIRLHDGRIVLAGLEGILLLSDDNGQSFHRLEQADRGGISKILQAADNSLVLIGEHGIKRLFLPDRLQEQTE